MSCLALSACGAIGEGVALPSSTSTTPLDPPEVVVSVSPRAISVDGITVVRLQPASEGVALSPADVREGYVPDLLEALEDRATDLRAAASQQRDARFEGRVHLRLDRALPNAVTLAVVDSVGRAGFARPWLVVRDRDGDELGIPVTLPVKGSRAASPAVDAPAAPTDRGFANPTVWLDPEQGFVVRAHDDVIGRHDGIVLPCESDPCEGAWPVVELNRLARRIKLDHPRDRAIRITPGPTSTVQGLVSGLDATRDDALAGRGTRELFPEAILAREAR